LREALPPSKSLLITIVGFLGVFKGLCPSKLHPKPQIRDHSKDELKLGKNLKGLLSLELLKSEKIFM
jgi:hypothetical protein